MKKLVLALLAVLALAGPLFAQCPPLHQVTYYQGHYYHQGRQVPASLFGIAEQRQIMQLQAQLQAQNAAQMAALQAQLAQQAAQNAAQNQMLMAFLLKQQAPQQQAPQPINIYLPPGYGAPHPGTPPIVPNPGTPPIVPNPGTPPIVPNPGTPPIVPNPGTPPIIKDPGVPKIDLNPGAPPKIDLTPGAPKIQPAPINPNPGPGPGTSAAPLGYQRMTTDQRPPVITSTITDRYGVTRPAPAAVWRPAN